MSPSSKLPNLGVVLGTQIAPKKHSRCPLPEKAPRRRKDIIVGPRGKRLSCQGDLLLAAGIALAFPLRFSFVFHFGWFFFLVIHSEVQLLQLA